MIIENKEDAIAALNFIDGKINQMNKVLEVVVAEPTTRVMISKLMEYLANTERVVYCKDCIHFRTCEAGPSEFISALHGECTAKAIVDRAIFDNTSEYCSRGVRKDGHNKNRI